MRLATGSFGAFVHHHLQHSATRACRVERVAPPRNGTRLTKSQTVVAKLFRQLHVLYMFVPVYTFGERSMMEHERPMFVNIFKRKISSDGVRVRTEVSGR